MSASEVCRKLGEINVSGFFFFPSSNHGRRGMGMRRKGKELLLVIKLHQHLGIRDDHLMMP